MKMRVQELHPMLIHAPLTLLPSAVAIDVAAAFSGGRSLDKTARVLWWSTAAGGVVAGIAGLAASQEVKADTPKTRDMIFLHGFANAVIVLGALGVAAWRTGHRASWASGMMGLGSLALVGYSAWLGGELVYSEGVGVNGLTMGRVEIEQRSPPLMSREAPRRIARDAVRGMRWLVGRARQVFSGRERIEPRAFGFTSVEKAVEPRVPADPAPFGFEPRPM
ncbi:DUF2231 domain-containing protein [Melittangium boletus]|uniref:DUF2231 domain-containing protein n=1 Tax=Melittangium boletus TaxID=83453 RepID=UPI003DA421BD